MNSYDRETVRKLARNAIKYQERHNGTADYDPYLKDLNDKYGFATPEQYPNFSRLVGLEMDAEAASRAYKGNIPIGASAMYRYDLALEKVLPSGDAPDDAPLPT